MRCSGWKRSTFSPKSSTSPPELSSRPAITESSVVFPQPLGPTRKVVSPNRTSKSMPRSASTRALPEPNSFFKSRQWTAVFMACSAEDGRRLQHQHAPDAEQAGDDDDEENAATRERHVLPHEDAPPPGPL